MASLVEVFLFSLVGGVLSLIAGVLLLIGKRSAKNLALWSTPFAAGVLLGAAFFDLLPEALEAAASQVVFSWTLVGLLFFFILERFMHWFHHHEEATKGQGEHSRPTANLIIIGDTLHNALDGLAIGAAFLISVPTGIVTSLAVAAHEVPQEVGDFGLLLKLGYKRRRIFLINIFSAFSTVPVAMLTFSLGGQDNFPIGQLLGLTAGFFLYIAVSDLIPRIHRSAKRTLALKEVALLIGGVLLVALVARLAHGYLEVGEHNQPESAFYSPGVRAEATKIS